MRELVVNVVTFTFEVTNVPAVKVVALIFVPFIRLAVKLVTFAFDEVILLISALEIVPLVSLNVLAVIFVIGACVAASVPALTVVFALKLPVVIVVATTPVAFTVPDV